ncbi:MAG: hypothetical protein HY322_00740 [Betaproteobacteria bacterium]|nr:hypothetical protein [Betaproteobacteria bacterium]
MPTLTKPKLTRGKEKLISTLSPDSAELSILFDKAMVTNDKADAAGKVESRSFGLEFRVNGIKKRSLLTIDLRGALESSSPSGWALILLMARGRRVMVSSSDQHGPLDARLGVPIKAGGKVAIAGSLIALRDQSKEDSWAFAQLDSLDIAIVDGGK